MTLRLRPRAARTAPMGLRYARAVLRAIGHGERDV
jgi:hypothetical protein